MASPVATPACCGHALWSDVTCDLPCGHTGSHARAATESMAELTWRSSSPAPAPTIAETLRTDYLELLRRARRPAAKSA